MDGYYNVTYNGKSNIARLKHGKWYVVGVSKTLKKEDFDNIKELINFDK